MITIYCWWKTLTIVLYNTSKETATSAYETASINQWSSKLNNVKHFSFYFFSSVVSSSKSALSQGHLVTVQNAHVCFLCICLYIEHSQGEVCIAQRFPLSLQAITHLEKQTDLWEQVHTILPSIFIRPGKNSSFPAYIVQKLEKVDRNLFLFYQLMFILPRL